MENELEARWELTNYLYDKLEDTLLQARFRVLDGIEELMERGNEPAQNWRETKIFAIPETWNFIIDHANRDTGVVSNLVVNDDDNTEEPLYSLVVLLLQEKITQARVIKQKFNITSLGDPLNHFIIDAVSQFITNRDLVNKLQLEKNQYELHGGGRKTEYFSLYFPRFAKLYNVLFPLICTESAILSINNVQFNVQMMVRKIHAAWGFLQEYFDIARLLCIRTDWFSQDEMVAFLQMLVSTHSSNNGELQRKKTILLNFMLPIDRLFWACFMFTHATNNDDLVIFFDEGSPFKLKHLEWQHLVIQLFYFISVSTRRGVDVSISRRIRFIHGRLTEFRFNFFSNYFYSHQFWKYETHPSFPIRSEFQYKIQVPQGDVDKNNVIRIMSGFYNDPEDDYGFRKNIKSY